MSFGRLWAFLAITLPVLAALVASLPATDLAYHLRAGSEILVDGRIPDVDTWTFSASGVPWFDQQWAAQVIFELSYRLGGWSALVVLRALLVGIIFGSLFLLCRRQGLPTRLAAWLTLGAFVVAAPALALRPQLLGMTLFALTLLLVMDRRARPGRIWIVPALVVVWANVHGSFFLGPAVLGLAWIADFDSPPRERHLALIAAGVAVVAACITPFGPAVWSYAVGLSSNPEVTQRIGEWQPTSLRTAEGLAFFGSALLVAAFLARRGRPAPWSTLAWLGFFFLIGSYAARGIAWWPLAAVASLSGLIETGPATIRAVPEPRAIRRLNAAIALIVVGAAVALLPVWRPTDPNLAAPRGVLSQAPSQLTGELRAIARPGDRLFNPQRWGSWFEYALPEVLVAIDSRIEMFPGEVWREYLLVTSGTEGWEDRLEAWQVTTIVWDGGEDTPFVDRLIAAGWSVTYMGTEGTILTRQ